MRNITVITGTRAEYGILSPVLSLIKKSRKLRLSLVVTSMHLSNEFGRTVDDIRKDGFNIDAKIDILPKRDTNRAMASSIGACIQEMVKVFGRLKPDIVLILGDRSEMLSAAVAAAYMNIPIAHIAGGDVSGNIDNSARHAISKFSHIHFASTGISKERLIRMGEEKWRIHVVGTPGLDSILKLKLISKAKISKMYGVASGEPLILIVQHPLTTESERAGEQMRTTLEAAAGFGVRTIVVYPNADAGGRKMIREIKKYEKKDNVSAYKSIPHLEFLSLMQIASVMVGNSSSGIVEALSFRLPVVNVGSRQEGRERALNVIDTAHDRTEIEAAIRKCLYDSKFKDKIIKCKNPFGDGRSAERMVKVLEEVPLSGKLLQKLNVY